MASMARHLSIPFLVTIFLVHHVYARDAQFFNKVPSSNGKKEGEHLVALNNGEALKNNQEEKQPEFIPELENGGYGLYGHGTGQSTPDTTTTTTEPAATDLGSSFPANSRRYLPKNYNTEAYVTVPEGYRGGGLGSTTSAFPSTSDRGGLTGKFDTQNAYEGLTDQIAFQWSNFAGGSYQSNPRIDNGYGTYSTNPSLNRESFDSNNGYNSYHNGEQSRLDQGTSYTTDPGKVEGNFYNGVTFEVNWQPQGLGDASFYSRDPNSYNHYVGNLNGVQKQGMSDTRFLENGKYFYDINSEKKLYNQQGPYGSYANPQDYHGFNADQKFYNNAGLP